MSSSLSTVTQSSARRPATAADVDAWHRVDVRCWPALARTRVTLVGGLGTEALEAIDDAIRTAEAGAHTLTLDLSQISSITEHARSELMTRGLRSQVALR